MLPQRDAPLQTAACTPPGVGHDTLLSTMPTPAPGLDRIVRYAMEGEGKRLRPRLLVQSARTLASNPRHLAEAATLVELLHNGTLLHDDVMDRARVRRGRPSVNRLWGDPAAILAGDFLLAAVVELALRTGLEPLVRLSVDTLLDLVAGQWREIQNEGNLALSEPEYLEIAARKTASLFSASCRMGGLIARGLPHQVHALGVFGRELGMAFQMLDDLHDYVAEERHTGKEPGRDLAGSKVTLPLIIALRNASAEQRRELRRLFADRESPRRLEAFRRRIRDLGGFAETLQQARQRVRRASRALDSLPPGDARSCLRRLAERLLRGDDP